MAAEIPTTGPTTFEKIGILNNLWNQFERQITDFQNSVSREFQVRVHDIKSEEEGKTDELKDRFINLAGALEERDKEIAEERFKTGQTMRANTRLREELDNKLAIDEIRENKLADVARGNEVLREELASVRAELESCRRSLRRSRRSKKRTVASVINPEIGFGQEGEPVGVGRFMQNV